MSEPLYWVVIRSKTKGRKLRRRRFSIVKRLGPMSYTEAMATREGVTINLDHERFTAQVNVDRAAYFAVYHKDRQANDKKYRVRKQKAARERSRRARANARGDMTPWLTQD